MFSTYHTTPDLQAQEVVNKEFQAEISAVIDDALKLLSGKGEDYNVLTTFIQNMPFGDFSWGTLCWIKAHRAAAITHKEFKGGKPMFDALNDVIMDLVVYAIAWLAFRRVRRATAAIDTKAAWALLKERQFQALEHPENGAPDA